MNHLRLKKGETPHSYRTRISKIELSLFKKYKKGKILEVCCGNGENLITLSRLGFKLTGIENSKKLLREAEAKIKESEEKVKVLNHPIYEKKFPFQDKEFDCVYSYQYLNHNFGDKIKNVFKEIFRIIKRDGLFSIKISDAEQFNFKKIKNDIYEERDPEFPHIRYRKVVDQTFVKLETEENGIPHYGFYRDELVDSLKGVGFKIINSRKIRWNIVVNCRK